MVRQWNPATRSIFRFKEAMMEVPANEEQIQTLAYRLWEEAGCPEGRSDEFWVLAQQQLEKEPGADNMDRRTPVSTSASET
ncbi:DUF2934 domain-containing protein [Caballeronia sp. S22]|uniref:DUF2934 domain-containing protein n=1 Tax=Caballeronia sp. S22 TaxID=3137182 RepID=UPI00353115A6